MEMSFCWNRCRKKKRNGITNQHTAHIATTSTTPTHTHTLTLKHPSFEIYPNHFLFRNLFSISSKRSYLSVCEWVCVCVYVCMRGWIFEVEDVTHPPLLDCFFFCSSAGLRCMHLGKLPLQPPTDSFAFSPTFIPSSPPLPRAIVFCFINYSMSVV